MHKERNRHREETQTYGERDMGRDRMFNKYYNTEIVVES